MFAIQCHFAYMGTPACKDCDGKRVYKSIDCQQRFLAPLFLPYSIFDAIKIIIFCMYIAKLNQMKIYRFQHVPPLPRLPAWRKMGSHPRPWWRWQNCFGAPPPIISFITFSSMFTFTIRWETSGTVLTTRSVQSGKAGDGRWGRPGHQVWEYLLQALGQNRTIQRLV